MYNAIFDPHSVYSSMAAEFDSKDKVYGKLLADSFEADQGPNSDPRDTARPPVFVFGTTGHEVQAKVQTEVSRGELVVQISADYPGVPFRLAAFSGQAIERLHEEALGDLAGYDPNDSGSGPSFFGAALERLSSSRLVSRFFASMPDWSGTLDENGKYRGTMSVPEGTTEFGSQALVLVLNQQMTDEPCEVCGR